MKDFIRAVRVAMHNRATLVGVLVSSLMVGVLWGANIGAVYPFVEVVFGGQSLQEWVDREIADAEHKSQELLKSLQDLRGQLPQLAAADRLQAEREINSRRASLDAEQKALQRYRWMRPYIHSYLPADPFRTLLLIVLALLLGTVLKDTFIVLNTLLVERLVQLTTFDLRKQFYRQTLRLDLAAFGESRNSELLSRFTFDMGCLGSGLNNLFGKALREPLKMIACLVGASLISWRLLVLSLMISPPALFLMRKLAQSIKRASRRALEEMSQLYGVVSETFDGIQTVKAFTMEQFERNRLHQSAKAFFGKAMRIAFYNSLIKPITELLGIGVISLALVAGAYLVLNEETRLLGIKICDRPLDIGLLLLFYGLLAGVSDPARKLSEVFAEIQGAVAAADRIYAMMDRQPSITDPPNPKRVARPHRRLVFDNVSFHYHPEQPVLHRVDLQIDFGETIAVVGPNGCGKTTLANLILRFYDPVAGAVRLDDVDLRETRLRDLRSRIGLVTQQTHLFDETILSNIRYGSPRASDEQVIEAAKKAHAHRFIVEKLNAGYDTTVGHGGSRLSGGQRQRVALARAILRDPEILILDEATSQIDIESEQLIHQALEEFTRGRTAIIITHRLSTLALADRIVVMESGRIIDVGPHDDLISRCPLYRRLHDLQFKQSA